MAQTDLPRDPSDRMENFATNLRLLCDRQGSISQICRKLGIAEQTFYRWRSKYAGMLPSDLKRLKQLEEEDSKLKKLVADLSLDKIMLQDVLSKKW